MNQPTSPDLSRFHVVAIKLTIHAWELPSWPKEHLRSATAGALRMAFEDYYPGVKVEIAYNEGPDADVVDILTGKSSAKGAKLEVDIRPHNPEHEYHLMQHVVANTLEGVMRRVLQMFIEHDAVNRFRQMQAAYKTYDDVAEPAKPKGRVLT